MAVTVPGMLGHKRHTEERRVEKAQEFNEQYLGIIKG